MTSESKILTVSYGTFSCTLEGFDDPFNTMKAIAEYFRDLTAEDRYFGAEPPQPDAAMLHRIAEREVSRLVDARVRENGVHLRPQDGTGIAPTPATPMPVAEVAPPPTPTEPALHDAMPDGVAAKLARVRHSVTIDPLSVALPVDDILNSAALDDLSDTLPSEGLTEQDPVAIGNDALRQLEALLRSPVADAAEDVAKLSEGAAKADEWIDAPAGDIALAAEAEQADDITAVDSQPTDLEPEDVLAADLLAEGTYGLLSADIDPTSDDALPDEMVFEDALDDAPQPDISFAPDLADLAAIDVQGADVQGADVEGADVQPEDSPDVPASLTEALLDDPLPEASDLDAGAAALATDAPVPAIVEAAPEASPEPAEADRPAGRGKRVNSRVVRLRPNDGDDARQNRPNSRRLAPGSDDAEISRLMRQTDDAMADDDNRRRLDSISHLKAAVVATEADRALSGETKPPADTRSDIYRDDLADVVLPDDPAPARDGAAAGQGDTPPEGPAVKPRRKTVSVRPAGPRPGTIRPGLVGPPPLVLVSEQRIDRFVAVPAAPPAPVLAPAPEAPAQVALDAAAPSAAIPAPAAPAPVLEPVAVAATPLDQQPAAGLRTGRLTGAIGLGAASPLAPQKKIVLEQPSQGAGAEQDDEDDHDEHLSANEQAGLVEFAERVGVKSMAEMLEAAAAYATCIEKRSQFTRPQLMRRLMASAGTRPVSREDGLRSFGTLLRTGRIEKVSRGHYMLAETSPYLAEARRLS